MKFFIAVGIMLSPRLFWSLGNAVGYLDQWVFVWIVVLLIWGMVTLRARRGALHGQATRLFPKKIPGMVAAIVRLALCCLLATSVLALAGYSFNEVFFFRFPNLGFTFLLLTVICGVHLFNDKAPLLLQAIVSTGAILGFGAIAVAGILTSPETVATASPLQHVPFKQLSMSLAPALLLFIGFELAEPDPEKDTRSTMPWGAVALLFMAALFAIYAQAARLYVPLEKLAYSSVPHMILGREVLGEIGRYLAGGAVIMGSVAAVNALLLAWRDSLPRFFTQGAQVGRRARLLTRFLASVVPFCIVALLLFAGYAGEPILEIWLGIAFGLYLLIYAGSGIACLRHFPLVGIVTIVFALLLAAITIYSAVASKALETF